MRLSSFAACAIDATAKVDAECVLSKVTMGKYSYVGGSTRITDTVIGSFCSVGRCCGIGGGVHPMDVVSTSPAFLKGRNILKKNFAQIPYDPSKKTEIGSDVWIGEGVCILSGVKIGDGAIIGAHAVVTHDIPAYAIVAGCPARVIRYRFDEQTVAALLQMKWWEWSDEKIQQYAELFESPAKLIEAYSAEENK